MTNRDYGGGDPHASAPGDRPWSDGEPEHAWSGGQSWSSSAPTDRAWADGPEPAGPAWGHDAEASGSGEAGGWSGDPGSGWAGDAGGSGWAGDQHTPQSGWAATGTGGSGWETTAAGDWRSGTGPASESEPVSGAAEPVGAAVAPPRRAERRSHARLDDREDRPRRRGMPLWQEIPLLLIVALCLALLVRTFLFQAFHIPSGSMEETLVAGDRVLVNKFVYNFREPERGEVVVFRGTDAWSPQPLDHDIGLFATIGRALGDLVGVSRPDEKEYIKRIIGLPGDRVSCCDVEGRIFINGHPLDEDYVVHNAPLNDITDGVPDCRSRRFNEIVVEPGHVFVMGDHRTISHDSRCQGLIPIENITGRAIAIVWPSSRWTSLSVPEAFAAVPPPTPTAPGALAAPATDTPATGVPGAGHHGPGSSESGATRWPEAAGVALSGLLVTVGGAAATGSSRGRGRRGGRTRRPGAAVGGRWGGAGAARTHRRLPR